ncbi:MAG TPA: hypothetical protein VNI53_01970 [Gammaproteobacteria bacterium]|nr:hypothetical protein [Gammaproteobacteria bacterium]
MRPTEAVFPVIRQARWRTGLLVLTLLCTVGIYSIEAIHHHKIPANELACPICHVMGHNTPNLFKPYVKPATRFSGWYEQVVVPSSSPVYQNRLDLRPLPRAPPIPASSPV